jgi:ADP-ribosylation factor related protein 1
LGLGVLFKLTEFFRGQTDLQSIWESYYSECHAIVFMVDSCDEHRISEVLQVFDKVLSNDDAEGVPVLMLANKQDMDRALPVEQIKEVFNPVAAKLGARDSRVMPVSALEGTGVKEAVEWLHLRLQRNRDSRPPNYR